jgi:hypothetical protein
MTDEEIEAELERLFTRLADSHRQASKVDCISMRICLFYYPKKDYFDEVNNDGK